MSDEIKDLDDVEAQAWVTAFAAGVGWAESYPFRMALFADECVRMLRERRAKVANTGTSTWDTSAHGRSAERAAIVAWLRLKDEEGTWAPNSSVLWHAADEIERGEHDHG